MLAVLKLGWHSASGVHPQFILEDSRAYFVIINNRIFVSKVLYMMCVVFVLFIINILRSVLWHV
jgi:hypothetical protein